MRLMLMALAVASALVVPVSAATFSENFSGNPSQQGWRVHGDPSLFTWNATSGSLAVTWDSSKTNSYFYRPLGTILASDDDFSLSFDLRLDDAVAQNLFQVAVGLLNLQDAARTNYYRGTGSDSPNLVEFNYFPDTGWGATLSTVIVTTNNQWMYGNIIDQPLTMGAWYRVKMTYAASNQTLYTQMARDGQSFGPTNIVRLTTNDFRIDAISISSYSEAGQIPDWAGTILAHGFVDNVIVTVPEPPQPRIVGYVTNQEWQAECDSRTNWNFILESTTDFREWTTVDTVPGNGGKVTLRDTKSTSQRFYRIKADRP